MAEIQFDFPGFSNVQHIHVMGAPGAGVTTLGRHLASGLGYDHFDSDDYHWFTSDPEPYRRRRNPDHRRQLLANDLQGVSAWVLTGSLCGWGDVFIPQFDLIIFCTAPADVRLERIRQRELQRYGTERLGPDGDLHVVFTKFLQWAAEYDLPSGRIRTFASEMDWLHQIENTPVWIYDNHDWRLLPPA